MRVFISADMEGIAGVVSRSETGPAQRDYGEARLTMTREVNAAVEGAFAAGAEDVLVKDGHDVALNLPPEEVDPRARVVRGHVSPLDMMAGIDEGFDAALFVGYHARSGGAVDGVLNHTLASRDIQRLEINGEPAGEARLNALIAGEFGVPVAFVSGDEATCEEVRSLLGPGLHVFATKRGIDATTAACLSPSAARDGIREGVTAGLRAALPEPLETARPLVVRTEWKASTAAHGCSWIPGVRLVAPLTTEYTASGPVDAMRTLSAMLLVAIALRPPRP